MSTAGYPLKQHSPIQSSNPSLGPIPFAQRLIITPLPPPGPSHYAARRKLWLTPNLKSHSTPEPSGTQLKLQEVLDQPGAAESEEVWKAGIEKVWKGLINGGRLKKRLPMKTVVKIIHAGWLRDPSIWPAGAVAPEPDDVFEDDPPPLPTVPAITDTSWTAISMPDPSSGTTTSWTAVSSPATDTLADEARPNGVVVVAV